MIAWVSCAVMGLVVFVLILATRKPNFFRVDRIITIHAAPERIFPVINDFRHWRAWSPHEQRDPKMQRTFSGATQGVGAQYEWIGNRKVGAGRMHIIESLASNRVGIALIFEKPVKANSNVTFTLLDRADRTAVTWTMESRISLGDKIMHTLINVDELVGRHFEQGLANLKALIEQQQVN